MAYAIEKQQQKKHEEVDMVRVLLGKQISVACLMECVGLLIKKEFSIFWHCLQWQNMPEKVLYITIYS